MLFLADWYALKEVTKRMARNWMRKKRIPFIDVISAFI